VSESKSVRFADQIWVQIGSQTQFIPGNETKVDTLRYMATVHALTSYDAISTIKPGDQIEWTVTRSGRTTVEPRMIEDATEQLLK
jgi:hypothetical protein